MLHFMKRYNLFLLAKVIMFDIDLACIYNRIQGNHRWNYYNPFVDKLIECHKNNKVIKYHLACKII